MYFVICVEKYRIVLYSEGPLNISCCFRYLVTKCPSFSGESLPSEMSCSYLQDSKKRMGQEKEREMGGGEEEAGRTGACRFLDAKKAPVSTFLGKFSIKILFFISSGYMVKFMHKKL